MRVSIAERLATLGLKAAPEWIEAVEGLAKPEPESEPTLCGVPYRISTDVPNYDIKFGTPPGSLRIRLVPPGGD